VSKQIVERLRLSNGYFDVVLSDITSEDIPDVLGICVTAFNHLRAESEIKKYILEVTDFIISKKATIGNTAVGCYLFNDQPVGDYLATEHDKVKYKGRKSLQGIALCVLPEYRNHGIGKKLRELPKSMNYDYIWGEHLKGLDNIGNWVKFGRRIIADTGESYITLMDLKSEDMD
jgi:GNAT superfamily N-acetyltransferase